MNIKGQAGTESFVIVGVLMAFIVGVIVEHSLISVILSGIATDISMDLSSDSIRCRRNFISCSAYNSFYEII
jgi:hypothetical protein